jgi:hypothetical protein
MTRKVAVIVGSLRAASWRHSQQIPENGAIADEGTRKLLHEFIHAYAAWVERNV